MYVCNPKIEIATERNAFFQFYFLVAQHLFTTINRVLRSIIPEVDVVGIQCELTSRGFARREWRKRVLHDTFAISVTTTKMEAKTVGKQKQFEAVDRVSKN